MKKGYRTGKMQKNFTGDSILKLKKNMHLYQTSSGIVLLHKEKSFLIRNHSWDQLVNRDDLYEFLLALAKALPLYEISGNLEDEALPPPIGQQEIWAAGVTYLRSKEARMKEAQDAGGGDFYDRVYDAPRPELFPKGNAQRAAGHRSCREGRLSRQVGRQIVDRNRISLSQQNGPFHDIL